MDKYYNEIQKNVDIEIEDNKLNRILSYISEKEEVKFRKRVELIKVKIWVENDSEAIKSGEINIDKSKYQGINIEKFEHSKFVMMLKYI